MLGSRGGVDSKISTEVWGMGGRGCIILILDGVSFDLASFINQTFRKGGVYQIFCHEISSYSSIAC